MTWNKQVKNIKSYEKKELQASRSPLESIDLSTNKAQNS
ncbi:hypothetical protein COO91_10967 (plasmid) [Nostoc flagelliforme CCNUN1]|uniref:Uncharacterized protein n=1 Tax=Nostoc flagelliforme CCNUN1 TaxID=2038116 RepID=A0A2K8TAK9_9NOSO|nr:hypothetical protein COO91_10967 [Nostoc flagelliforme CCNUN1]